MADTKKLEQIRNLMQECVDILDDFLALKQREDAGEDIAKECDAILGRFFINMLKLSLLQNNL